jgi:hypothetical protein
MKLIKKLLLNEMSPAELKQLSYNQMAELATKMELVDKFDTMNIDYGEDFDVIVEMVEAVIEEL